MKKFMLYDEYDGKQLLAECDTMQEVRKACKQQDIETGGEWLPALYKLVKKKEGQDQYKYFDAWTY